MAVTQNMTITYLVSVHGGRVVFEHKLQQQQKIYRVVVDNASLQRRTTLTYTVEDPESFDREQLVPAHFVVMLDGVLGAEAWVLQKQLCFTMRTSGRDFRRHFDESPEVASKH